MTGPDPNDGSGQDDRPGNRDERLADRDERLVDRIADEHPETTAGSSTLADEDPVAVRKLLEDTSQVGTVVACIDALAAAFEDGEEFPVRDTVPAVLGVVTACEDTEATRAAVDFCLRVADEDPAALVPHVGVLAAFLERERELAEGSTKVVFEDQYDRVSSVVRVLAAVEDVERGAVVPTVDELVWYLSAWPAQRNLHRSVLDVLVELAVDPPTNDTGGKRDGPRFRWGRPTEHVERLAPHTATFVEALSSRDGAGRHALRLLYVVARDRPGAVEPHLDFVVNSWRNTVPNRRDWLPVYGILSAVANSRPAALEAYVSPVVEGAACDFARLRRPDDELWARAAKSADLTSASLAVVVDLVRTHPERTAAAVERTRLPVLVGAGPSGLAETVPMLVNALAPDLPTEGTVAALQLLEAVATVAPDAIAPHADRLERVRDGATTDRVRTLSERLLAECGEPT